MSYYASRQDILDRLSVNGVIMLGDDNDDGGLSTDELAVLDKSLAYADAIVDALCGRRYTTPFETPVQWVVDRAIELATGHYSERKGYTLGTMADDRHQAIEWLGMVQDGDMDIPGESPAADEIPAIDNYEMTGGDTSALGIERVKG